MALLRLSVPTAATTTHGGGGHQDLHIMFCNERMWQQALGIRRNIERGSRRFGFHERFPRSTDGLSLLTFGDGGLWKLVNLGQKLREPCKKSSEDSEQQQQQSNMSESEWIEHQRNMTRLILEGKHERPPDRNYTGDLKQTFRAMHIKEHAAAATEAIWNRPISYFRNLRNSLTSPTAAVVPQDCDDESYNRGWKFLHRVIVSSLSESDRRRLPSYNPQHKALILFVEQRAGRITVQKVRNLEACSRQELLGLLRLVQARGWRDVIWVAKSDADMPTGMDTCKNARVLEWGSGML